MDITFSDPLVPLMQRKSVRAFMEEWQSLASPVPTLHEIRAKFALPSNNKRRRALNRLFYDKWHGKKARGLESCKLSIPTKVTVEGIPQTDCATITLTTLYGTGK